MPVFTIGTPSGAQLDIEAPDQATAILGAQEWDRHQQDVTRSMQPQLDELGKMSDVGSPEQKAAMHDRQAEELANLLQQGHEGSSIGAASRGFVRGGTLGLNEKVEAGLGAFIGGLAAGDPGSIGDRYALTRDALFKVRDRERASNPVASTAGEIAGSVATPIPLGLSTGAGRSLGAWSGLGRGAAEGAIGGGIYGAGQAGEGQALHDAAGGALTGGVVGGALGAVAGPVAGWMSRGRVINQAPSVAHLDNAAGALYDEAARHGAIFRPQAIVADLAPHMNRTLNDANIGINQGTVQQNYGRVMNIVHQMQGHVMGNGGTPMSAAQLEAYRRNFRDVLLSQTADQPEKAMAAQMMRHIDDFMDRAVNERDPARRYFIAAGPGQDAQRGVEALRQGRATYAAARRGEDIDYAASQAVDRAGDTGFGENEQNLTKQAMGKLVRAQEEKGIGGFNATDLEALNQARRSGAVGRKLGMMSPGRSINSITPALTAGGVAGGGAAALGGAILPWGVGASLASLALGVGGRKIGERLTRQAVQYASAVARLPRQMQRAAIQAGQDRFGIPAAQLIGLVSRIAATQLPQGPGQYAAEEFSGGGH